MSKASPKPGTRWKHVCERRARLGYDDWLLREEGHVEDEGNSRLDNLEELCVASGAFPTPADFLAFVAAQNKPKEESEIGDAVEMMTIHRAKGLEWPVVFVVGFAFGMLPHHRSLRWLDDEKTQLASDSIEEERRLAYVAITRAKRRVFPVLALAAPDARPDALAVFGRDAVAGRGTRRTGRRSAPNSGGIREQKPMNRASTGVLSCSPIIGGWGAI